MSKIFIESGDVFSYALSNNIDFSEIKFEKSDYPSPYFEINSESFNTIDFNKKITINLLYRFSEIDYSLFINNISEDITNQLIDLIIHLYSSIDLNKALNFNYIGREIFLDWFENSNLSISPFIIELKNFNKELALKFSEIVLESFIYGFSEYNLYKAFKLFFQFGKIYKSNKNFTELIFFLNEAKSEISKTKFKLLESFFIPIYYTSTIFYDYHFGVIGSDSTMRIDNTAIIE